MRIFRAIGGMVMTVGEALVMSAWGFLAIGLAMTSSGLIQQMLVNFLGFVPFLLLFWIGLFMIARLEPDQVDDEDED